MPKPRVLKQSMVVVRLDEELVRDFRAECKAKKTSQSFVFRVAILSFLGRIPEKHIENRVGVAG